MKFIQIIGIIFALIMSYLNFLHFRRREMPLRYFIIWALVWLALFVFALIPGTTSLLSQELGLIGDLRTMDFLLIIGFMGVLGFLYQFYIYLENMKKRLEKLVRDNALKSIEKRDEQ